MTRLLERDCLPRNVVAEREGKAADGDRRGMD